MIGREPEAVIATNPCACLSTYLASVNTTRVFCRIVQAADIPRSQTKHQMQVIVTVVLTLAVTMAAVDPRARWCDTRCQELHETDCPDQDQCPEISSEESEDSEEDTLENSICVSPCEDLKDSCTSSCYKAYTVCQAGCRSSRSSTSPPQTCFRPCFEEKFEQLQEAPSP